MERLRAAIRERWHERPLLQQPPQPGRLKHKRSVERHAPRATLSVTSERTPSIPAVRVRKATLERSLLVAAQPDNPEHEAYLGLQAAVLQCIDEEGLRVIGVTSPSEGSGKTLTAVNLAISLATMAGRPTMIVDFDLSAPQVHKLFGICPKAGLEDYLSNDVSLNDVLFSPSIDGVAVLPARGGLKAADELMRSGRLATVLERIERDHSDAVVVLDLPSLNSTSDGQAFEALVDGMLLVVEDDVTEERDYRRALQSLSSEKLIGTVLNRVPSA
jgi:protein-tyrosine kinase